MKNSIKLVLVLMVSILTNTEIYGSIVSINTGGIDGKNGELEKRKIEKREVGKRESKLAKAKINRYNPAALVEKSLLYMKSKICFIGYFMKLICKNNQN